MVKLGLSKADKEWTASLVRWINQHLDNIEQDIRIIKEYPAVKKN